MASRARKLPPDHEIIKRREREDRQATLMMSRMENERWGNSARWEIKTTERIMRYNSNGLAEELRVKAHEQLLERRKKLAKLLHDEQMSLELEYKSSFESSEQRRLRLAAKAKDLKSKREAERKAFADAMYQKQQRMAQDEMRLAQSQLRTRAVARARKSQLDDRVRQAEEKKSEDAAFALEWEQNRLDKIKREEAEERAAMLRNKEMREMLDTQMRDAESRQALAREEIKAERAASRIEWAAEVEQEKEAASRIQREQYSERLLVQRDNAERARQRAEEKRQENQLDLYLLKMQLDADAAAEIAEEDERKRVKQAAIDFQKHLEELAIREAVDDTENEAVRKEEQEKAWKKREDQWERERLARERLMKEVNETRKHQIAEKIQIAGRQKSQDAAWTSMAVAESKREDEAELQKQLRARKQRVHNQGLIKQQIQDKETRIRLEKQREYLDNKRAVAYTKKFEADIRAMRDEALKSNDAFMNYPKIKVPWN